MRRMLNSTALFCSLFLPAVLSAADIQLSIDAGDYDRVNVPVRVLVELPKQSVNATVAIITLSNGTKTTGQFVTPGLKYADTAQSKSTRELVFVAPKLESGKPITADVTITSSNKDQTQFNWDESSDKHYDLKFGDRSVLRYMCEKLDESTPARRGETYKVYHHVYDFEGKNHLTKGPGGLFPHHRGLFYGFNKISYTQDGEKRSADIWHCKKGEFQSQEKVVQNDTGPVLGRHLLQIDWHGQDGNVFAEELREMTVYTVNEGHLIEFASKLTSKVDDLKLDGDPQHAGFQFRATQHVPDKTKKLTFYIRPDGTDKPGSFRNWPGQKEHINLVWNAQCFTAFDQQYTCCYLDRPKNPKPARFSERDYGRFGSYFATEVNKGESLDLNYRIAVLPGEQSVDRVDHLSLDFVNPPVAQVAN